MKTHGADHLIVFHENNSENNVVRFASTQTLEPFKLVFRSHWKRYFEELRHLWVVDPNRNEWHVFFEDWSQVDALTFSKHNWRQNLC